MTEQISKTDILKTLNQVKHPEMNGRNLVELQMVKDVDVNNSNILVTLALPNLNVPIKDELIETVKQEVVDIGPGMNVEVKVVEMNPEERSAFSAMAREEQNAPKASTHVKKIIAVLSGKGGVGKSSVAGLLASSLRRSGYQVGILDADITGPSIPKLFGLSKTPEVSPDGILPVRSHRGIRIMSINLLLPDKNQPVVWRGPLIGGTIKQFWTDITWGDLDFLILDLPPGTSDAALTVMQSLPLDGVLLVTSPQDLAGMVVRKAANMAIHLGVPIIGLIENMSYIICPQCGTQINVFGSGQVEETARSIGTSILGQIALDSELSILCDRGEIEEYHSDAFEIIAESVVQRTATLDFMPTDKVSTTS
jgi:Mrp family chromosome partitioning ATPase